MEDCEQNENSNENDCKENKENDNLPQINGHNLSDMETIVDNTASGSTIEDNNTKINESDLNCDENDSKEKQENDNQPQINGHDLSDMETIVDNTASGSTIEDNNTKINESDLNCDETLTDTDLDPLSNQNNKIEKTTKNADCNYESDNNSMDTTADEILSLGESNDSDIELVSVTKHSDIDEIHEIHSDDMDECVLSSYEECSDDSSKKSNSNSDKHLVKPTSFQNIDSNDESESDYEVIPIEDDPLKTKKNNNMKVVPKRQLIHSKKQKSKLKNKKTPDTVTIADPNKIVNKTKPKLVKINPVNNTKSGAQNANKLKKNKKGCSTTNNSVVSKNVGTPQISKEPPPAPEPLLPSLTDDMFVVEAPSFIVPYVYEKPSLIPFKEFVKKTGEELEAERLKAEELRVQKEKEEKERIEKELKERKERGEDVTDLENQEKNIKEQEAKEKMKKKLLKQERRRRRRGADDDDPAWEADNLESSESDDMSEDDEKKDSNNEEEISTASQNDQTKYSYFNTTLGNFFLDIGVNQVQEFVQADLLVQENRKLKREKRHGRSTKSTMMSIASLQNNIERSKAINTPFNLTMNKCKLCSFQTESMLIMAHHLEVPHMRNNMYICNTCHSEFKNGNCILIHMMKEHQIKGRLESSPASQQCANCPYEDNQKHKLQRHLVSCAKRFRPETNLCTPHDWEPPAKIPMMMKHNPPPHTVMNNRVVVANPRPPFTAAPSTSLMGYGQRLPQQGMSTRPALIRTTMANLVPKPSTAIAPNLSSKQMLQPNLLHTNVGLDQWSTSSNTSLPRGAATYQPQSKESFVICEICDGYIKDLDNLKNHMQWFHKVKIHPKMIINRPPLNCQKCQFRFFTDHGLERHLLGFHGLVTSLMQEAANKKKDSGRCPICGRVYQYKLLGHVARDHNVTLKPAHLSYKCTVCTATFNTYKEFESHVYSAHRMPSKLADAAAVADKQKAKEVPMDTAAIAALAVKKIKSITDKLDNSEGNTSPSNK